MRADQQGLAWTTNVRAPAVALAALAVPSALATAYLGGPRLTWGSIDIPLLPGLYFGAVMAVGGLTWGSRRVGGILISLAATLLAWVLAVKLAEQVYTLWPKGAGAAEKAWAETFALLAGGFLAGALGASLTFAGAMAAAPQLRRASRLLATTVVGAVLGLLLQPAMGEGERLIVLCLPWQVLVAATIGHFLAGPARAD